MTDEFYLVPNVQNQQAASRFAEAGRMMDESFATSPPHDLPQHLNNLVQGVVRANLRIAQEMFSLERAEDLVSLQQRFLRQYLEALHKGIAMLSTQHNP